jgi:flagellin
MIQMADRAMEEQSNILDTIKGKLVQAATDTTSDEGRHNIAKDINKLLDQLKNIADSTNYNGTYLLQQSAGGSAAACVFTFHMGENSGDTIKTGSADGTTSRVRANIGGLSLTGMKGAVSTEAAQSATVATVGQNLSAGHAQSLLSTLDSALSKLNEMRTDYGSTQVQLESSVRNLDTAYTNLQASESIIRDVDYAAESANFNKLNIIAQAGTYAMSQANAMQQNVQKLLQ